jgi:hypothetical protein
VTLPIEKDWLEVSSLCIGATIAMDTSPASRAAPSAAGGGSSAASTDVRKALEEEIFQLLQEVRSVHFQCTTAAVDALRLLGVADAPRAMLCRVLAGEETGACYQGKAAAVEDLVDSRHWFEPNQH